MIYVPDLNYQCYVIYDKDTIRAYKVKPYNPSYNSSVDLAYTDIYINSHYLSKDGSQRFNSNTTLPTCIASDKLTTDFYYRNDLDSILVIFTVIVLFGFGIPFYLLKKLYRRL